jgi:chromosome segregation ATPase
MNPETVESVEHVVVEQPAAEAAPGEAAEAAEAVGEVVAAEAAVALAQATAAAAELDAAERTRRIEAEGEEWRREISERLSSLQDSQRAELQRHETERLALAESLLATNARLAEAEAYLSSIRPASEEPETEAEPAEPLAETEAAASLGPLETSLDASLDGTGEPANETSEATRPAHPVRKRRWI